MNWIGGVIIFVVVCAALGACLFIGGSQRETIDEPCQHGEDPDHCMECLGYGEGS